MLRDSSSEKAPFVITHLSGPDKKTSAISKKRRIHSVAISGAMVRALCHLVSHYGAIGDTISCDAPYSVIGFGGKLFLRKASPLQGLSLDCDRPFLRKEVGVQQR